MTAAAFALVLTGACCHAGWNMILKRTGGGTGFFLLFSGVSAVLLATFGFAITVPSAPQQLCLVRKVVKVPR